MKFKVFEKEKLRAFYLIPTIVVVSTFKSKKKQEYAISIILFNYGFVWCFE